MDDLSSKVLVWPIGSWDTMSGGMAFKSDELRRLADRHGGTSLTTLKLLLGTTDDTSLVYLLQRCPNLTTLALRPSENNTQLTSAAFGQLARHCPRLTSMDLSDTAMYSKNISVAFLSSMQAVPLKFLHMRWCKWLTDTDLETIATHCKQLVELDISHTFCTAHGIMELVLSGHLRVATLYCSFIGPEVIKPLRDSGICPPMKILGRQLNAQAVRIQQHPTTLLSGKCM